MILANNARGRRRLVCGPRLEAERLELSSAKCARQVGKAHGEYYREIWRFECDFGGCEHVQRDTVVVNAGGASPSTTSEIENKGGFEIVKEQKRIKFVPYQPEEEQYNDHFFSINLEGD